MSFPSPTFLGAHGVLQFENPAPRNPGRDELFITSVQQEFPNVLNRTFVPADTPAGTPHLTLASTSSQLALSAVQADFEVRFYGDYMTDIERGLEYVERKLAAVLRGLDVVEVPVVTVGLIGTLNFSFKDMEEVPAKYVLRTHLRTSVDAASVQDALARVAVRVRDTYFVTLTLSNYERRTFEQQVVPGLGLQFFRVRPWEGRIDDTGVELTLDINNNLEARVRGGETRVTVDGIKAVARLLREIATSTGPTFAETGTISVEDLVASSAQ